MKIDFVIPAHPKDFESLALAVAGLQANVSCVGRILIVADTDPGIDGATFVHRGLGSGYAEQVSIERIEQVWRENNPDLAWRAGWIYQQMVKLLTPRAIDDLTETFVTIDADTIFLRDISFDSNLFFYTKTVEYLPMVPPIKKLLGVNETIGFSANAHHMIYNRTKLEEMVSSVEARFDCSFVEAVLSVIDYYEISNLSELDLWTNFMLLNYPDLCQHRQLNYLDIPFIPDAAYLAQNPQNLDFVSCHEWMRV